MAGIFKAKCKRGHDTTLPNSRGRKRQCRACKNSLEYRRVRLTSRIVRNTYLLTNYNITLKQYEDIFNAQKGCCAICRKANKLNVDHDHITKQVRGLLCYRCNRFIVGAISVNEARAVISYLKNAYGDINATL